MGGTGVGANCLGAIASREKHYVWGIVFHKTKISILKLSFYKLLLNFFRGCMYQAAMVRL